MPEPREHEISARELLGYDSPSDAPESTAVELLVLKRGALFAVTNRLGDIAPAGARDQGLFLRDTRYLSHYALTVAGGPPVCLSSQTSREYLTQVDLTCTRQGFGGVFQSDPVNFLHLRREQLIDDHFTELLTLTNFVTHPLDYWVELEFAADFADVFEVRGHKRARRGTYFAPELLEDGVRLAYVGLDRRRYLTELHFSSKPTQLTGRTARFEMHLQPNETHALEVHVVCGVERVERSPHRPVRERIRQTRLDYDAWRGTCARFSCSDEVLQHALEQGVADLKALLVPEGAWQVVSAGVPWYAAPFGRDSLITAFEALPVNPLIARDTLAYLASLQGKKVDKETEEEPGKIMHEMRYGEMAHTHEIPHRPYYGSIDATPLFLVLLSEYHLWSDDSEFVESLWPAAEAAIAWLEKFGDPDGDLFLEYRRTAERGLINQGWKDSRDGVCFPDGAPLEPPIALVEVQGYAYDANRRMAQLSRKLGKGEKAHQLAARARALARRIEERFYLGQTGFYALALDGQKRAASTITSNPGHLLFSRAIPEPRAGQALEVLFSKAMWSGWGIRTLAKGQRAYNPLSYHNGTVWPHDNALIAWGAALYGHTDRAVQVLEGLFAAVQHFRHQRLPELFCGLARSDGEFPVHYPVACSPQAWSSAALFLLVRAMLGLAADAPRGLLQIKHPRLPEWVSDLRIEGLRVGRARLDLHFSRSGDGTSAAVARQEGEPVAVRVDLGPGPMPAAD